MLARFPRSLPVRARRRFVCATAAAAALLAVIAAPAAAKSAARIRITAGALTVEKVGANPLAFPNDVRDAVMATITRYVKAATVAPLRTGVVNQVDLDSAVDPSVAARLGGPDRATLLDEGLPKAVGLFTTRARPVTLTALADANGRVVVVTARLVVDTVGRNERGKFHVTRTGELVLSPQPDSSWRISAYDLTVDRTGKGLAPAAATSTSTTGAGR